MQFKIVADSSSDIRTLAQVEFASVPLKITFGKKTYVDDDQLDVSNLVAELREYKGKTVTACPSPEDWLTSFGEADYVLCITITSTLSGSCNAARLAAREYEENHLGRRVHVIDTLSAGPEIKLMAEKLESLILRGVDFDALIEEAAAYLKRTRLVFSLKSLHNLVQNGRVSPAVGMLAGLLGIRVVGKASDRGDLEPMAKCRGDKKALQEIFSSMCQMGYKGGKARIDHCFNEEFASTLKGMLLSRFPGADVIIDRTSGLCSYYAEEGGVLIGFETEPAV